jgi:hypothetical protein
MAVVSHVYNQNSQNITGAYGLRHLVAANDLSDSGVSVRVHIYGNTLGTTTITDCYIGQKAASGDAYDMESGTITQLTFNTGQTGATLSAGQDIWSDWVAYTFTKTNNHIISYGTSDRVRIGFSLTATVYYKASAQAEAGTANVTGYSTGSSAYFDEIQVDTGGAGDLAIDQSDSVTTGESSTLLLTSLNIESDDTITTGESLSIYLDSLHINDSDSVSVGEDCALSVFDPILSVSVADAASLSEDISASLYLPILIASTPSDSSTLNESATVDIGPPMYDAGWISEAVTIYLYSPFSVHDTVAVGESATILLTSLTPSVSDSASLSEGIATYWQHLNLSVNDSAALAEAAQQAMYGQDEINVYDSVTVSDSAIARIGNLFISVSDTIYAYDLLDDGWIGAGNLFPSVSDTIHVREAIRVLQRPIIISSAYHQYLGSPAGEVFEYHESYRGDNGQTIPCYWISKNLDFIDQLPQLAENWKTVKSVKLIYNDVDATDVIISVSNDDGETWTSRTKSIGTGDGTIKEAIYHFWKTGKYFKFKVEHASAEDRFQWIRLDITLVPQAKHFEVTA